ncbi:DoxX family protein [Chitinophaga tropicalis]|uniref:DoxX family membrane protein n=1 Tax=Chitinophaga tropicalis TaxID=2683588 RepID=A0A7K1UA50_9BACT|nr:DoxX family protein [Chitinophaga tropicalis]MVT11178.1 DoxX family membrane protein [Chitinophaga tropicalis]
MINNTITFLLLRLAIGASMFGHGLVRLSKLDKFSAWMVQGFEKSMLPSALVTPFSYALPIAEFVVGLTLILGLFTRLSLIAGGIIMILLILGTTLIENWEALTSQLVHAAFFALLLSYVSYNGCALDNLIRK